MTEATNTTTKQTPTRAVPIRGLDPLVIAIDITASMGVADTPSGDSRLSRAKTILSDLIRRLPRETLVTVFAVGADVRELARNVPAQQARAALLLADANASACNPGLALERVLVEPFTTTQPTLGARRTNFVFVTDGDADDRVRWDAWQAYNAKLGYPVTITVLTVGDGAHYGGDDQPSANSRTMVLPLDQAEFQISTPTGSDRPGEGEPAKRPTVPPSLSPPSDDDAVQDDAKRAARARVEASEIATDASHIRAHGDRVMHEAEIGTEPDPAHSPEAHERAEHEVDAIREHAEQAEDVKRDLDATQADQREHELAELTPDQRAARVASGEVAPDELPDDERVVGRNMKGEPVAQSTEPEQWPADDPRRARLAAAAADPKVGESFGGKPPRGEFSPAAATARKGPLPDGVDRPINTSHAKPTEHVQPKHVAPHTHSKHGSHGSHGKKSK